MKRHYHDPASEIISLIDRMLDDVNTDRNFGEVIRFRDIFSAIEALDCVSFVYELSLIPDDRSLAELVDSDVYPRADVLCRAGEINIETVTGD